VTRAVGQPRFRASHRKGERDEGGALIVDANRLALRRTFEKLLAIHA
jgi:hypothetical protein